MVLLACGVQELKRSHQDLLRPPLSWWPLSYPGRARDVAFGTKRKCRTLPELGLDRLCHPPAGHSRPCAGFRTPAITRPVHMLRRPASKKRQGTKSREVGHRRCSGRYGDLMAAPSSMMDVTPTGLRPACLHWARLEECNRHLGKRSGADQRAHGASSGVTGSREIAAGVGPAHRNGKARRSREVWLMMCRSCSASDATSARSRVRTPRSRSCGRHSAGKGKAAHVACPRRYPAALAGRRQAGRR